MSAAWGRRLAWGVVTWVVVFFGLGYPTLQDPDEAHYAELTREMLQAGNWLVPLLDGKPFIDKPVLFHWLQGASVLLLGETEFAARLPSALAAVGLIAIVRWAGVALLGLEAGEWGALMFATIPATFALSSLALFDMVFTMFLFGAVACLLVAAKQRRVGLEFAGYGLLTLAVMTKGPVALALVSLFVAAALLGRSTRGRIANLHWKIGLPAVAIAAAPWYVWMYVTFGRAFIHDYVLAGNLWYVTQPREFSGRAINHTFYARAFAGAFFPWSAIVLGRAVDVVGRWKQPYPATVDEPAERVDERLLWTWIVVVIAFFSAARFKLDHYIYPAAPACCLVAALAWRDAGRQVVGTWGTRAAFYAIAGFLVVAGAFGGVLLFDLNLELPEIALLLPNLLVIGGAALLFQAYRAEWHVPRNAFVLVSMLVGVYALVVVIGFPVLEQTRPTATIARRLQHLAAPTTPVGLYRLERWRASVRYYVGRPVTRLDTVDEVRDFLDVNQPVYVVMIRREYNALLQQGLPVHMIMQRRAVVGTTGGLLRKQRWGDLVVVTNVPRHRHRSSSRDYE